MTQTATPRRALVTGASAGIGEAFARRLARDGYHVAVVARRRERLAGLAQELERDHQVTVEVLPADLTVPDDCARIEGFLRQTPIDLLVNNAGFGTLGDFHELSLEREVEQIGLNVVALIRLTHAALAGMVARRQGGVLNVASMAAFQPIPHNATYAATKAFVLYFSEAVHEEMRPHGVTVTAVCPGPVRTEFQQVAGIDPERMAGVWTEATAVVEAALAALRAGRAVCVPGALNALAAASVRLAPRFVARQVAGSMMRRAGAPAQ